MLKVILNTKYYQDISSKYQTDLTLEVKIDLLKENMGYKKIQTKVKGYASNFLEGKINIPKQTLKQIKDNIEFRIKEELQYFSETKLDSIIFEEMERIEILNRRFYKKITNPTKIKLVKVNDEIFNFLEQKGWTDECKCKWENYNVWGYCNNQNIEEEFGVFYDGVGFFVSENAIKLYPFLKKMVV